MNQAPVRLTPAVKYLLILNGLVYFAQLVGSGGPERYLALVCRWNAAWQIWRFFSYAFLHSGVLGFLFFVLALILIGSPLEERLGTVKFLLIYLGSVLTGGLAAFCSGALCASALFSAESCFDLVIGSWAGILGTLAYLIRLQPEAIFYIWILLLVPIKAAFLWWFTAVSLVVMSLAYVGYGGSGQADLGGFIFGSVAIFFLEKVELIKWEKKLQKRWQAWKRRRKFRRLSCLNGHSGKVSSPNTSLDSPPCTTLKLLPSRGKEEKPTNERRDEDNKLDALMYKLASQGAKSLTQEERRFLDSRSQKTSR